MLYEENDINWVEICWPAAKLDQALEQIAIYSALSTIKDPTEVDLAPPPTVITKKWIGSTARQLGMLVEEVNTTYGRAEEMIRRASPALFQITNPQNQSEPLFLIALRRRRQGIVVLTPDLKQTRIKVSQLRAVWCYHVEHELVHQMTSHEIWDDLNISAGAQAKTAAAVAQHHFGDVQVEGCWLFFAPPHASLWQQMRQARLIRLLGILVIFSVLQQATMVGSWSIIGQGALNGQFDTAYLWAWVLIMFTGVIFQVLIFDLQGPLATNLLRLVKNRLLYGALQMESDEIRHQGSGQFFGRVLESDMVQNFLIGGALISLPFGVMLVTAGVVLYLGVGGIFHVGLLVLWTLVSCYIGWLRLYYGVEGMRIYRGMTNDLVENMIGHRTRLAQENRTRWHEDEDKALAQYTDVSRLFDWNGVQLDVLIPRGWFVIGLAGIAYSFVTLSGSIDKLAISIGGVLLGNMAFESLAQAMKFFAQATISWQQVAPLLKSANRTTRETAVESLLPDSQATAAEDDELVARQPVVMLRDVTFQYGERGQPILQNCHLTIMEGDQLLLEGPSGGGKSTLAAVISGLRQPQSGLLLLWGFDSHTIGEGLWRRRVVTAPQFQENHIFTDTIAFNLLMGRGWPPTPQDLEDAERVCLELGLGDLLKRMPDGLNQIVGDGGWQLSFGERSRLYIGRALLQNADLVILDESFGALDPESLKLAMECVLRWTKTLLVIAHP